MLTMAMLTMAMLTMAIYAYYGYAYYGNLYLLWQSILTMARLVRRRLSGLIVGAHRGTIRIQSDVRL